MVATPHWSRALKPVQSSILWLLLKKKKKCGNNTASKPLHATRRRMSTILSHIHWHHRNIEQVQHSSVEGGRVLSCFMAPASPVWFSFERRQPLNCWEVIPPTPQMAVLDEPWSIYDDRVDDDGIGDDDDLCSRNCMSCLCAHSPHLPPWCQLPVWDLLPNNSIQRTSSPSSS